MSDPLRDELLSIARAVEALKRECGMDPESPTAIQNGRYMGISYRLRALADRAPTGAAPAAWKAGDEALILALMADADNYAQTAVECATTDRAGSERRELEANLRDAVGPTGAAPGSDVSDGERDALDAARWRAVKARHAMRLVRLATNSGGYNSARAPAILDAWADMAKAEIEALSERHRKYIAQRIVDLQDELHAKP